MKVYRKPTTSPVPIVHDLFEIADEQGIGLERLTALVGYNKDAVMTLRRPNKSGHGRNPSIALVRDVAAALGYRLTLEKIDANHQ